MTTTELKRLAEAATPGIWIAKKWCDNDIDTYGWNITANGYLLPLCEMETDNPEECDANAAYIAAANPAAILKILAINAELVEALKGLDEAYCRAGPQLTRDERNMDRKRLIIARAALAKAEGGEL